MKEKIEQLEYAKDAVMSCLKSANCSVDFKGIVYWAGVVERLRKEIIEAI